MNENNDAMMSILEGVDYLVDSKLNNAPFDRLYSGVITKLSTGSDNLYTVNINGNNYDNIPSLFKGLKLHDTVYIMMPQNQMNQMFILGKYDLDSSSGGGGGGSQTVYDGILTIKRNNSTVATFTANSENNVVANITVPTEAEDVRAVSQDDVITSAEIDAMFNSYS